MRDLISHFIYYRFSRNWSYVFVSGFLLFLTVFIQILTGVFIACKLNNYFNVLQVIHSITASLIIILLYTHIYKSLYYRVDLGSHERYSFITGVVVFLFIFLVAFSGYVIPWGQMSFWGTKVITNYLDLLPIFGTRIKEGIWGSDFMSESITRPRFLSLHIILGCFLWISVAVHVYVVHSKKSITVPISSIEDVFKTSYLYPNAYLKDFFISTFLLIFYSVYLNLDMSFFEEFLNNCPITLEQTPFDMSPEWYFLPSFSVLKFVEDRAVGVLFSAFLVYSVFSALFIFSDKSVDLS